MSAKTLLVFGARHLGKTLAEELSGAGWNVAGVALSADTVAAFHEAVPDGLGIAADATRADEVGHGAGRDRRRDARRVAPEATDPYVGQLVPAVFNALRTGCRVLGERGNSTISMIRLGQTFDNLMVDVVASNEKLRARCSASS